MHTIGTLKTFKLFMQLRNCVQYLNVTRYVNQKYSFLFEFETLLQKKKKTY